MKRRVCVVAVLSLLGAGCREKGPRAPLYSCVDCDTTAFTVVFRDSVSDPAALSDTLAQRYAFTPASRWTGNRSQKGFTAKLDERALDAIRRNPRVAYIQRGAPMATP